MPNNIYITVRKSAIAGQVLNEHISAFCRFGNLDGDDIVLGKEEFSF
jgi:hypothetical protein